MIHLTNHLWQSTLFTVAAFLLALSLRRYRAQIRYWVWMAASLKFLVPFSWLTSLGETTRPDVAFPAVVRDLGRSAEPFAVPVSTLPIPDTPSGTAVLWLLPALWCMGALAIAIRWIVEWRRVQAIRMAAVPARFDGPVPVLQTDRPLEPGVIGIVRPVVIVPAKLTGSLTAEQVEAILTHEFCHARRHDNLTAALHALVQTLFWFHPLVWWIGARLAAERENACDEAVVRSGRSPRAYAEGITAVCRISLESAFPCASGVTGADLHRRLRAILAGRTIRALPPAALAALIVLGAAAVAVPVLTGFAQNEPDKLKFDVASIRESKAQNDNSQIGPAPGGGLRMVNVTTHQLIVFAYGIHNFQLSGAPGWASSARYDILAKTDVPEPPPQNGPISVLHAHIARHRERLRGLLAERFQLTVHREKKEVPVYAITLARSGHKLREVKDGERPPSMRNQRTSLQARHVGMEGLTRSLSEYLGRPVVDETGLAGVYDFELSWAAEGSTEGPTLFTAIQEQLGLKLESKRAPADTLVVDRIERPSEN